MASTLPLCEQEAWGVVVLGIDHCVEELSRRRADLPGETRPGVDGSRNSRDNIQIINRDRSPSLRRHPVRQGARLWLRRRCRKPSTRHSFWFSFLGVSPRGGNLPHFTVHAHWASGRLDSFGRVALEVQSDARFPASASVSRLRSLASWGRCSRLAG